MTLPHHALPEHIRADLHEWKKTTSFAEHDGVLDILLEHDLPVEQGHYKTYWVSAASSHTSTPVVSCYAKDDPRSRAFGFNGFAEQVYAVSIDGQMISACVSVRENEQCAEAWVATAPGYQRRGYAKLVVRAWASQVVATGKVPFYSHRIENTASAGLARGVGCIPLFEEITFSQRA